MSLGREGAERPDEGPRAPVAAARRPSFWVVDGLTEINCQKRSACGAIFGNCDFSLACKQFKKYINYTRQQEIRLTDYSTFLPENGHLSEKLPNRRLKENPQLEDDPRSKSKSAGTTKRACTADVALVTTPHTQNR